jgi:hypothetical protein
MTRTEYLTIERRRVMGTFWLVYITGMIVGVILGYLAWG